MAAIFQFPYRTVAEISLRDLVRNLHTLRGLCRKEIIPVIKADAYGHGMIPIARALIHRGSCHVLAVATLEEAIELRKKYASVGILVLSGFFPHQLDAFNKFRLTPVIHTLNHLKSLLGRRTLPDIHLKFDTGMHRLGLLEEELPDAIETLEKLGIKLAGLATHFAESETTVSSFADQQIARFTAIHKALAERRLLQTDARIHIANSGGILRDKLGFSVAVRPGIALYGISPNPRLPHSDDLLPVLRWKTRILCLKEVPKGETVGYNRTYKTKRKEKLAILPIGYADGYPRLLTNRGHVLVAGKKAPVRGRVSMDLTAVDVSGVPGAREGMEVTLIGKSVKEVVTATDIGNWADTIPYEIFCGISPRVPRVYFDE